MMRVLKWIGVIFTALGGAVVIGLYLLALSFSREDIRALLDQEIHAATGRNFAIEGDINILPGLIPTVEVTSVSLGNAPWSKVPIMLRAERLSSRLALRPLLEGRLQFEEVTLEGMSLLLETDAEGRNNWDIEASQNTADTTPQFLPSQTPSDQVRDILASLHSLAGHFDNIYINDLSVQYLKAGNDVPRMFNIAWFGLEAADQDNSLTLDITGDGAKEGQTLHLEIGNSADFLAGQGDLGLTFDIDALRWSGQITGVLRPEETSTIIKLDVSVKSDDLSAFYADVGEAMPLPNWSGVLEPLSLNLRTRVSGSLRHPTLERLAMTLEGNQGSRVRAEGRIEDLFGQGSLSGSFTGQIGDPIRYGAIFLDDGPIWTKLKDGDLGPMTVRGDLNGRLTAPVLSKGTVSWGRTDRFRAELQNLDLSLQPLSLSTDLSFRGRDDHFLRALTSDLLPPSLIDIPSSIGEITIKSHLKTSPAGLLNAENIEASIGALPALHVTLSGTVDDLLGKIDPILSMTLTAGNQLYIRKVISSFVPDDFPINALAIAPLEVAGAVSRTEAGSLTLSVSNLGFGDPEVYRVTAKGSVADLDALTGMGVTAQLMAKDSPRLREVLSALSPEFPMSNIPGLGMIALSIMMQQNGRLVTIPTMTMGTGGVLPLTISGRGEVSLEPTVGLSGRVAIEGPDLQTLRDTVAHFLPFDNDKTNQIGAARKSPKVAFRAETGFTADNDGLTFSGLDVGFLKSRLTTNIQATNLSGRPQVQLTVPSASLHLSDIDFLFGLDEETPTTDPKARFFRQQLYDFSNLADFDMDVSVSGELAGMGGPILEHASMELVLEQGRFLLKSFRGKTVKGDLALSGHWNAAGAGDPEMTLDLAMNKISLGTLLQRAEIADWLKDAPLSGTVKGTTRGRSPSALAASFTGGVRLSLGPGQIDKKMIDWLGGDLISNVYTSINPFSKTLPYSQLECGEAHLTFTNGLASFEKGIAVETKRVALIAGGQIDLDRETLDLSFASTPKEGFGPTIGGAGSLVKLKGRLNDPKISVNEWDISKRALSVGTSILTSGLSTLAETMFDRLTRKSNLCQTVAISDVSQ